MIVLPGVSLRVVAAVAVCVAIGVGGYFLLRLRVPDGPLTTRLGWLVERASSASQFSGTVLVARHGTIVFSQAEGRTAADGPPLTMDSRFPIASLSKTFTAVAILQLIQAKQLSANDTLAGLFPSLADTAAGAVTVHQLLTHTSGIDEVISRDPSRRIAPDDLRTAVITPTLFEYSNTGYVCLALVLERVTGLPYSDVIRDRILIPAGMTASGLFRSGEVVDDLARGDGIRAAPVDWDFEVEAIEGAGSIYSTTPDLARFDRALASGTLLSAESLEAMTTPHVPDRYGYGWMLGEQGGRPYAWHSGDLPGFSAYLARVPARDEVVVVLSNRSGADVRGLATQMLRQLRRD
jgi:CubicO group peptidase (beta-lactamase class C family)